MIQWTACLLQAASTPMATVIPRRIWTVTIFFALYSSKQTLFFPYILCDPCRNYSSFWCIITYILKGQILIGGNWSKVFIFNILLQIHPEVNNPQTSPDAGYLPWWCSSRSVLQAILKLLLLLGASGIKAFDWGMHHCKCRWINSRPVTLLQVSSWNCIYHWISLLPNFTLWNISIRELEGNMRILRSRDNEHAEEPFCHLSDENHSGGRFLQTARPMDASQAREPWTSHTDPSATLQQAWFRKHIISLPKMSCLWLKHSESGVLFLTEKILYFWFALKHNGAITGQIPFQIWGQYHQKWASCIGFPKKDIWRLQKDTWKLNDIMGLMKCKILLLTKLYNTFILRNCGFTSPACHSPLPQTPCPYSYPQTATGWQDHTK